MLTTNIEKEFVRECILSRVRCDGRQLFDYRKLQVTMFKERGTIDINVGSLEVCLGNTRVLARIRADIITPKPDRPSEGPISFKIDTSIKGEESRKLSTEISKLFEKIIKGSNALDPNSLCITTGKYVWSLVCETILLSDDGNIIDAMCYALLLALLDFRKPGVKVEKGELLISEKQVHQALSIHHIPVSFTFGLIENGVFMDPHRKEQEMYQGRITITMNIYKDICSVHKPGGMPIQPTTLMKLTEVCELKVQQFTNLMRDIVKNRHNYELQ